MYKCFTYCLNGTRPRNSPQSRLNDPFDAIFVREMEKIQNRLENLKETCVQSLLSTDLNGLAVCNVKSRILIKSSKIQTQIYTTNF